MFNKLYLSAKIGVEISNLSLFIHFVEFNFQENLQIAILNKHKILFKYFPHLKTEKNTKFLEKYEQKIEEINDYFDLCVKEVGEGNPQMFSERVKDYKYGKYLFFIYKKMEKDIRQTFYDMGAQKTKEILKNELEN